MRTPYDTGKVKIGSNYNPDLRPAIDGDMEYLQTALIGDVKKIKAERITWAIYWVVVAVATACMVCF